jgi:hypothetical protein
MPFEVWYLFSSAMISTFIFSHTDTGMLLIKFPKELASTYSRHLAGVPKCLVSLFSFISIALKPDFLNSESSSTLFTGALKSTPSSITPALLRTSFAIIFTVNG